MPKRWHSRGAAADRRQSSRRPHPRSAAAGAAPAKGRARKAGPSLSDPIANATGSQASSDIERRGSGTGRLGRAYASLSRASRLTAPGDIRWSAARSMMLRARLTTRSPNCSGSAIPAGRGSMRWRGSATRMPCRSRLRRSRPRRTSAARRRGPRREDGADCRARSAFSVFVFGDQDGGVALCRVAWAARGSAARVPRMLAMRTAAQNKGRCAGDCVRTTLDLIASFQHAVVGDLMKKTFAAAEVAGCGAHPRHRGRRGKPRTARALYCRSCAPRQSSRVSHPGALHRQRGDDRRCGVAPVCGRRVCCGLIFGRSFACIGQLKPSALRARTSYAFDVTAS